MDAEQARLVLAHFVLRARRVEAHSLAADPQVLASLCNPKFDIEGMDFETGEATVVRRFPSEEQVESAAARVRPITLEGDPVHWGKALNALGFLLREAGTFESYRQAVKDLRKSWRACTAAAADSIAVMHRSSVEGQTSSATDRTLARAWLYGDVIHADPDHLETTRDFGVRERYLAAVPYIAVIVAHTKLTLDLIRHTMTHGGVNLPDALFEGEVIVQGTRVEHRARVFTADVGTALPTDATTPLGPEWRSVRPSDLHPNAAPITGAGEPPAGGD